jgi:hypothetical protein
MPIILESPNASGGGSGTVTQVSSANAAIAVATGTTTPVLTAGTLDVIATAGPPAAAVAMNAKKITGLAVATVATDAASLANTLDQFGAPAANVAFNAKKITGLAAATAATDAASLANTLDLFGAPAGDVAMNSHKLTGLAAGSASGNSVRYEQILGLYKIVKTTIAFNAANLASAGVTIYTPSVGDVIIDLYLNITTVWNGTTPKGDFGTFTGNTGLNALFNSTTWDMTIADNTATSSNTTLTGPGDTSWVKKGFGRGGMIVNSAANNVRLVVSQTGAKGGADPGATQGSVDVYLVVAPFA